MPIVKIPPCPQGSEYITVAADGTISVNLAALIAAVFNNVTPAQWDAAVARINAAGGVASGGVTSVGSVDGSVGGCGGVGGVGGCAPL